MSDHDAAGLSSRHTTAQITIDARDVLAGRYDDTTVRQAVEASQ